MCVHAPQPPRPPAPPLHRPASAPARRAGTPPLLSSRSPSSPQIVSKKDFVKLVAEKSGVSAKEVATIVETSLETIVDSLKEGKKVSFLGFGSFQAKERAARMGRNPRTGEPIAIKAQISPGFSAGKSFKESLN
jgi:DNA-binding protein HU-beta